ncbi:MOSC domain-containing protein [Caenimonas terrae]|uniref:MOSC domain-containing protein n=1 Tax=Caenimonas terrae TaxID=696074 RepID=A0ABW0N990_9BURK
MSAHDLSARIERLFVYPVKSCAGVELGQALLTETGFDLDRAWMVVDEAGEFVTQRELPRMALVRPQLKVHEVVLRAPGMLALHLQIDAVEEPARVRIWGDEVGAYDMGPVAAQWFSDFLGRRLRLVRFDPERRRLSSRQWTGELEAPNQFSDGFPLLVAGQGSLDLLNQKLAAQGHAPVTMERFRPNIVLAGLEAHDEDRVAMLEIAAEQPVRLQPVKPCGRCPIPDIDPLTAQIDPAIGAMLRTCRSNELLKGAISFGMNLVIVQGVDQTLKVGQQVSASYQF